MGNSQGVKLPYSSQFNFFEKKWWLKDYCTYKEKQECTSIKLSLVVINHRDVFKVNSLRTRNIVLCPQKEKKLSMFTVYRRQDIYIYHCITSVLCSMMWKKERDTGGVQGSDWIQDLLANSKHSAHWSNWFLQTLNKRNTYLPLLTLVLRVKRQISNQFPSG